MAAHLQDTIKELEALAQEHERVAVGFSGGKDSLAVLDLAMRTGFKTVIPFFYYFVPGLKCEEAKVDYARERYGLEVLRYPGDAGLACLKGGVFCDEFDELSLLPDLTRRILYNWIKADTQATLILDGEKKADGIFRRRRMANQSGTMPDVVHPIREWLKWEVLSYLKAHSIPIPDPGTGDNGSVSLLDSEILHLHKFHPEDYEHLKTFFPYIETVILREEWFGTPEKPDGKETVTQARKPRKRRAQASESPGSGP